MKRILGMLFSVCIVLTLGSCGKILHDGTAMAIARVEVDLNASAQRSTLHKDENKLQFGYSIGGVWHNTEAGGAPVETITDGKLIYTFNPPLIVNSTEFTVLIGYWFVGTWTDDGKIGESLGGSDAKIPNSWTGETAKRMLKAVVNGKAVTWTVTDMP